jgi:hypothetical protein
MAAPTEEKEPAVYRYITIVTICLLGVSLARGQTSSNPGGTGQRTAAVQSPAYPGMPYSPHDQGQLTLPQRPSMPTLPMGSGNRMAPTSSYPQAGYPAYAPDMYGGYGYGMHNPNDSGQANSQTQNRYIPSTAPAKPLAAPGYPSHEPPLEGLAGLKLAEVYVYRGDVVNVKGWMRPSELATLITSVNADQHVYANAARLTERLQSGGLLHAGDRVVGYHAGKVYAIVGRR